MAEVLTERVVARLFHDGHRELAQQFHEPPLEVGGQPWEVLSERSQVRMEAVAGQVIGRIVDQWGSSFGWALQQLQAGHRVFRRGWNGHGMYLVFSAAKEVTPLNATAEHLNQHGSVSPGATARTVGARIDIVAADGVIELGWRPTSRDMLATDWDVDDLPF